MRECLNVYMSGRNLGIETSGGANLRFPGRWYHYVPGVREEVNTQAKSSNSCPTLRIRRDTVDG